MSQLNTAIYKTELLTASQLRNKSGISSKIHLGRTPEEMFFMSISHNGMNGKRKHKFSLSMFFSQKSWCNKLE